MWQPWARDEVTFEPLESAVVDFFGGSDRDLAIIVVRGDGEVIHRKGYGSYTAETIFLTASAAKPVAAGILQRLHERGLLDMQQLVSQATSWGDPLPGALVEHLVTHRAGIPGFYPQDELANSGMLPGGWAECYTGLDDSWTLQTCREALVTALLNDTDVKATLTPPGSVYRYGGSQWGLAAALAEEVSGTSFKQLFEETYVQPCGLTASGWVSGGPLIPQLAGSVVTYETIEEIPATENPIAEGGLHTTLDDFATILLMHLHSGACPNGRAFSQDSIATMHRAVSPGVGIDPDSYGLGDVAGYGYGWYSEKGKEDIWVGTVGSGGVWGVIDKQRDLVFVIVNDATDNLSVDPEASVMPVIWDVLKARQP